MIKLKVKKLTSLKDRSKGLIRLKKIYPVYFETRFGIHTFGMKVPIDIFVLDDGFNVVKVGKNIMPGNLFFWNPKYKKIIETPTNFLKVNKGEIVQLF